MTHLTTHEVLAELSNLPLRGKRVVVQRYGETNRELQAALAAKGAEIVEIATYRWGLPDDIAPLQQLIGALDRAEIDVVAFTSASQAVNSSLLRSRTARKVRCDNPSEGRWSLQLAQCAAPRCGSSR